MRKWLFVIFLVPCSAHAETRIYIDYVVKQQRVRPQPQIVRSMSRSQCRLSAPRTPQCGVCLLTPPLEWRASYRRSVWAGVAGACCDFACGALPWPTVVPAGVLLVVPVLQGAHT